MDIVQQRELRELCDKQIELAAQYKEAREKSATASTELDILLVAKLPEIRREKSNVGYEMAIRILMENNTVAQKLFNEYTICRARYKGLEKLIEAHQNKISAIQSYMRYTVRGERSGF